MKSLEFSSPDFKDKDSPQEVVLYDQAGGEELGRMRGASAPNPQIPGQPDRPNMSEYPIVHPGTYLGTYRGKGHHGKPCIKFRGTKGKEDGRVPILQDENPRYPKQGPYAIAIRVHEEWSESWRGSAGCMTLEKPGGNEFLKEHFKEGEVVSIFIPNQDWFANA
jgi:hypothetical protein